MRAYSAMPLLAFLAMPLGCSDSAPKLQRPFQELYDAGLTKYSGTDLVQPSSAEADSVFPNVKVHRFPGSTEKRGPLCMSGSQFNVETRDGTSDELLVFLGGGGLCLSDICLAATDVTLTLGTLMLGESLGVGGILSSSDRANPLVDSNVVYVPSCDGSMFMGDVDRKLVVNGFQSMAYQRGLQNLTAAFEVAKSTYPKPSRLVLAGTGAGAYAMVVGLALARFYYPDTEIAIISDSGAPIMRDGDRTFARRALTEIKANHYLPTKSCPDCLSEGHFTSLFAWALDRDPNFRVAFMSHADDLVTGDVFMDSQRPIFRLALVRETASLASYGDRVHRFITPGRGHTYLLNIPMLDLIMGMAGQVLDSLSSTFGALDPMLLLKLLSDPSSALDPMTLLSLLNGNLSSALDPTPLLNSLNSTLTSAFDSKNLLDTITGPLSKYHTNQSRRSITGYQWLREFLWTPETLVDVVNTGDVQ